ncbi:MAG: hypothetical protein WC444_02815 [Candidatus Paceibacterota bacterium]
MTTSETILTKIHKENIKPKAKWYFVVEHAALWIPGIAVTLLGAVAVAGGLFASMHTGWEYQEFVYASQFDFITANIPFIWVLSFALFGGFIVKALRTTHFGYRYSLHWILLGSVTTSVVLGIIIYKIDDSFEVDSVIRYPVHEREQRVWSSLSEGRLAGYVEKKEDSRVVLRDKDDVVWVIDFSGFGTTTFPFVEEGKSIRIIGTTTGERVFVACMVFPWDIGAFPRAAPPMRKQMLLLPSLQNKNPDCTTLLDDMKNHMRGGERKVNVGA